MSKKCIITVLTALLVMALFLSGGTNVTAAAKRVSLSHTSVTLEKGENIQLELKNSDAKKVKWKSGNKSIATVKAGVVKAKKAGKTTIAAIYGGKKYKCRVTVKMNKQSGSTDFDLDSKTVTLNSGYEMPIIGLGTWTLSNEEAENSVYNALKTGMRLIDTARYYDCEKGVGKGLKKAINEGLVKREDVFITSKIYTDTYKSSVKEIDNSLKDLDVSYVDLMLIHEPGSDDKAVYKALEEAVEQGKVRSIGISNYYTKDALDEVLSFANITPAIIQNENHIYYQNEKLKKYAKKYGIVIESWYPFGGRGHTDENFNNETIAQLAKKYKKSSAQVILRWHLQAGYIAIPGSSNAKHIAENYDIFDFELSEEDMKKINSCDRQKRYEVW